MLAFLILHGLIGGFDVLYNHEWVEHLPSRPAARIELLLHAAREALFASLFLTLAWWQWHGSLAWIIALLLAAELCVTGSDILLENKTRHLNQVELFTHVLLLVNYGLWGSLLVARLLDWHALPSGLAPIDHGWQSWTLSLLGAAALCWSVRDALSGVSMIRLHRLQQRHAGRA